MIGRGPGGSAARLLCSRSAAAARPPWDRVGGRLSGVPQVAARGGDRDRGRGAAGGAGPMAPAPLSLRSATRVGGGERWQMASGRGGPRTLGNRAEHRLQPTPPQHRGEVGQKMSPWPEKDEWR